MKNTNQPSPPLRLASLQASLFASQNLTAKENRFVYMGWKGPTLNSAKPKEKSDLKGERHESIVKEGQFVRKGLGSDILDKTAAKFEFSDHGNTVKLKKGDNVWDIAKEILIISGKDASNAEVMKYAKQICRFNSIAVKNWNLEGDFLDTQLPIGKELKLPSLKQFQLSLVPKGTAVSHVYNPRTGSLSLSLIPSGRGAWSTNSVVGKEPEKLKKIIPK